jgi:hypothetical protein
VQASAAQVVLLDDKNLFSQFRRRDRGFLPARSRTENDKVVLFAVSVFWYNGSVIKLGGMAIPPLGGTLMFSKLVTLANKTWHIPKQEGLQN